MKLPRFVPILTAFTARVAGRELEMLMQSPTLLARALAETQVIVGHDGVLCHYDPLLLASACLKKPRETGPDDDNSGVVLTPADEITQTQPLSTLLESIRPLRYQLPETALIFASFTGPALLYSQLQAAFESCNQNSEIDAEYVLDVIRSAVKSSLQLQANGIALIERVSSQTPEELLSLYKGIRKLADFYDAGFLIFNLPGSEQQDAFHPAHCVFDLASPASGIGPISGRPGQSMTADITPFTTAGDVAANTAVEELKAL